MTEDPVGAFSMKDCDGGNNLMMVNRSYAESVSKPLRNLTYEQLQDLRKKLREATEFSYCDGWLKDIALAYVGVHGYLSLFVCVFGVVANMLNIVVLTRREMASAPINKILTGLAVADMVVMLEYVPFALFMIYEEPKKNFSYRGTIFLFCHAHFSQVMHTISIFLTLTLAVWRYIAIRLPQRSIVWCSDSRCHTAIGLSYILPVFLCIPSYFITGITTTEFVENNATTLAYHLDLGDSSFTSYDFNFWLYAVAVKLLPCVILTVISICLINALYEVNKRKRLLKGYNACGDCSMPERLTKAERRAARTTRMLVAVLLLFLITEFPQGLLGLLSGIYGRCFYRKCYQYFGSIMDIFALLNGAINFILYCSMSRQFRLHFSKLFKPKVLVHWGPRTSNTDVHSTFV